jgi:ABC-type amino acid transport substrate-binding protein
MRKQRVINRSSVLFLIGSVACAFIITIALTASPASGNTLADIKKEGAIRHLGIPYANFVTGAGDGMDVELLSLFAKHLGVRYEYIKTDWGEIFADLTGKKFKINGSNIECLGNASVRGDVAANGITVIPWRQKIVDFSLPTFPNQVWLVARANSPVKPIKTSGNLEKDIAETKKVMQDMTLLGKKSTCLDPSLYNLEVTGAKICLFTGGLNEIAPAVINGEADLTLLDVPDALVALQKWPGKIKIIGPVSGMQDMAIAFSKGSPELRMAFNSFLQKCLADGTYDHLIDKYYPFAPNYFPAFFKKNHDKQE